MLTGSYDYSLVLISLLVAILASYTALDLAGRVTSSQGRGAVLWIVAQGVETESQQAFLTGLGCDSLQGFLFGKPVPAEQFMVGASALA